MSLPEKHLVLACVVEKMSEVLAQMAQAAEETRKDATHEEAKPENDKDTRALEQSYLARGQAMRAEQLAEQKEVLRFMPLPTLSADALVCAGALVELEDEDGSKRVLFSPVKNILVRAATPNFLTSFLRKTVASISTRVTSPGVMTNWYAPAALGLSSSA
jgi:hypothetical protein